MTNQSTFRTLALALLYFALGHLGLMLPAFGSHITLIWLPTGMAVAALLRYGLGCWPGVTLGAFAVNLAGGMQWQAALVISVGNTAGPMLAARLLPRMGFHAAFDRQRDILLLAAAAALGMAVPASLGVATLALAGTLPGGWLAAWLIWWAGDTMGVITAAPLLLCFTRQEWRGIVLRRTGFLIWVVATALLVFGVFVLNKGRDGQAWSLAFLPLPMVAWVALRFGAIGSSLAIIVLSVGAAYATATGRGPFHRADAIEGAVMLWLFMVSAAVLGWLITALQAARLRATRIQRLLEQALSDVSLGVLLSDPDRKITYANAGFTRLTGYGAAEMVGRSCRILQGPATDPAVAGRLRAALHGDGYFDGEILNYRKDGATFWNGLLISPVRDKFGVKTGYLGIQRDVSKRREAEADLRESEERFRSLIEHAPEAVMLLDPASGRLVQVNSAAERLFKLSAAELSRVGPVELSPPMQPDGRPSGEMVQEFVSRALAGETPVFEWMHRDAEGRDIPCEVRLLRLEIGGRAVVRGSVTDITGRKQAEARSTSERAVLELLSAGAPLTGVLDRLARSYEEIFPGMLCSILLMDADGRHLRHGAAPGLPAAYCQALDGAEIGPAVGSCGTAAHTRQVTVVADIATDPLWVDYRELALDHGLRACWSVPVISSQDRVLGTFAVYYHEPQAARPEEVAALQRGAHFAALAIERHQLLQSLQESEAALQAAQERAQLGSWELDLGTSRGWWSREMHRLFRHDPSSGAPDLAGFLDLVHPEDRQKITATHTRLFEDQAPQTVEFRSDPARGPLRYFSAKIESLPPQPGRSPKAVGTVLDVTASRVAQIEREALDRKVQETQKLESLGVLAGGIAHDFNNLLTGIIGNASLAAMDLPPGSPMHEYLEPINEAALRAADLCKQMLAYSGRGRFVVQRLELGRLVEETAQMLQISISKKAVLRFRLGEGLPLVEVDATQIRQVIMNLVINASEAIGDKSGVIALSTGLTRVDRSYLAGTMLAPELPEGEYVFLEVADNGSGMSPETQARIFDPFFTTKFTGRGLGLAAVLGIVRGHKGAMKVYSEPGRGTTFKLLFPAMGGSGGAPAVGTPAPAQWVGHGTVLVVDDEETVRSTVARMLRLTGLEPVLAADGREAVEIFRADPARFALVLLDLTMPHMDGEETFTELRRLRADVRVVLISGFNQQEALLRFPGKGLACFLQKPFTAGALRAVLQDVLG